MNAIIPNGGSSVFVVFSPLLHCVTLWCNRSYTQVMLVTFTLNLTLQGRILNRKYHFYDWFIYPVYAI